jgi:hypothetical protein
VPPTAPADDDPVLRRRARVVRLSTAGKRLGYACFALAMVLFFVGLVLQLPGWAVGSVVAAMLVGSVVLLPSIILGYGAKAADKEDRGEKFGY